MNHHRRLEHPELPAMGRNYHSQTPRIRKDHRASLVAQQLGICTSSAGKHGAGSVLTPGQRTGSCMTHDTGKNRGKNKGTWHPGENLSCVGGGVAPNRAKTCRQKHHYQERGQWYGRKGNPCPLLSWCLNMRVQHQDKQAGDTHTHTHTHTPEACREDQEGRRRRGGWGGRRRRSKGKTRAGMKNNQHKYFILFFF